MSDPMHRTIDAGQKRRERERQQEDKAALENLEHLRVYDKRTHEKISIECRGAMQQLCQDLISKGGFLTPEEHIALAKQIMNELGL